MKTSSSSSKPPTRFPVRHVDRAKGRGVDLLNNWRLSNSAEPFDVKSYRKYEESTDDLFFKPMDKVLDGISHKASGAKPK